jgi:hypothetical protein
LKGAVDLLDSMLRLDPVVTTWAVDVPMPTARHFFARAVLFKGAIYVVGAAPRPHQPRVARNGSGRTVHKTLNAYLER